jgi:hypothetical protein
MENTVGTGTGVCISGCAGAGIAGENGSAVAGGVSVEGVGRGGSSMLLMREHAPKTHTMQITINIIISFLND